MNTNTIYGYDQDNADPPQYQPQAHIFIYENLAYVNDLRFIQDRISIGSNPKADVVLDHQSVEDFHAWVYFDGPQAYLANKFPNDGLRLNGRSAQLEVLQHEDVIDIGPFSLKVKMNALPQMPAPAVSTTYAVRLVNCYHSTAAISQAVERLAKLLRSDPDKIRPLVEKEFCVIKRNLTALEANRWQDALMRAGIRYDLQIHKTDSWPENKNRRTIAAPLQPAKPSTAADLAARPDRVDHLSQRIFSIPKIVQVEDAEDAEDEIWEAQFSLHQKLTHGTQEQGFRNVPVQIQVIKSIGSSVLDVAYLAGNKKYTVDNEGGRIGLVRFKPRGGAWICITSQMRGYMENAHGQTIADLDEYKSAAFFLGTRRTLYRVPVPEKGAVVIDDGQCRYRVRYTPCRPSPKVAVAPTPPIFTWRHWAYSAGTHLFFLLCISIYLYFQAAAPKVQTARFVKIDPTLLQHLEARRMPKPPKIEPPPPQPEPMKVAEKLEPPKKKPEVKRSKPILNPSRRRPTSKSIASVGSSRHPRAGGGFGQGNIKNRNINQTGILSVLGSNSIGGPSEAIAAVTNLDAVPVPGASEKNFTVGGVKGSLGNGRIAVATGAMIQTKGSRKVLRSAGARGTGEVAALERGSTGERQIQAMVTAKMSRTVRIEGGMSREMVKQVIDQHLQEITYCYENALMSNPNIMGRMVFEWKILMDGRVGEVRIVASSVNSHEIHDCIRGAIKSWRFPKPQGSEVVVSYPFVFDLVAF
jgi:Inner membrane component of T3SS, cytoplasmic domain